VRRDRKKREGASLKQRIVYGIPNCDTVKKARAWLDAAGLAYRFHDFKKQGVPDAALARWLAAVGWERLLNRQGTTWRKLDTAAQAGVVDAASASALMQAQPSVIRRPVIEDGDAVIVGFDAERYAMLR
jgi:arsenate reductase